MRDVLQPPRRWRARVVSVAAAADTEEAKWPRREFTLKLVATLNVVHVCRVESFVVAAAARPCAGTVPGTSLVDPIATVAVVFRQESPGER